MKVTIITTSFNSGETITDTLRSVAAQNHPDIEHIIIDGGSRDQTLGIIAKFSHVSCVVSETDGGIYEAMNKGICLAAGDVVGILNSDDIYADPGVISAVCRAFQDASVEAVYGDLQYVSQNDTNRVIRTWRSGRLNKRSFYYGWMPPHPAFFVRRKVYEQVGLFDTTLRTAADYEMMLRILLKHQLPSGYLPQVLVKMRAGGMSNATVKNRLRANREDRIAWKLNGLKPYFFTLYAKPMRKIVQYLIK